MPTISVKADVQRAIAKLQDAARRQIPFAAAAAVNDLAFQVQRAENAAMPQVFAHPRPFTAKSTVVDRARKSSPVATVSIRPEVAKYLAPYEYGGPHTLPGSALLKPVDIRLDQYGQLPRDVMKRLQARPDIFIGKVLTKAGPVTGVWQRVEVSRKGTARRKRVRGAGFYDPKLGALKLLIRFGNALEVKKHLDFHKRAEAIVQAGFTVAFGSALAKALRSTR